MNKGKIWFTSDTHMGHAKILEYMGRPFADLNEMHTWVINKWNETVKPGDTVYVLGDFAINPKYHDIFVPMLLGIKRLCLGNHDNQSAYHLHSDKAMRKAEKIHNQLCNLWKSVDFHKEITLSNGQRVLLSHMPYIKDTAMYDERYLKFRPEDKGLFLLHGHLHKHYIKKKNMIDVGIDGELKLWSEEEIIALINDEREFIPSVATKTNHTVMGDDSL